MNSKSNSKAGSPAHEMRSGSFYRHITNWLHWIIWMLSGRPEMEPHGFGKRSRLRHFASTCGCVVFVETGTYLGDTVAAMRRHFSRVVSIELSFDLHQSAKRRFARCANVELLHGDSGQLMPAVIESIKDPALFWLDGHYSGGMTACGDVECPIISELQAIGKSVRKDHVIIIDDARLFGTDKAYPTLAEVKALLHGINHAYTIEVKADAICAYIAT